MKERRPTGGLLAPLVVLLGVGCGGSRAADGDRDAGLEASAPEDAVHQQEAGDVAPQREGGLAGPAEFVLVNATDRAIYIQSSGWSTQGYWSVVDGAARLPVDNTCEACDCGACSSCAVCGRSLAKVKEIKAGERHTWTWDGRTWPLVQDGCRPNLACEQEQPVAGGAQLQLEVTYSFTFAVDTSFGANDEFIGEKRILSRTFSYPPVSALEVTASP